VPNRPKQAFHVNVFFCIFLICSPEMGFNSNWAQSTFELNYIEMKPYLLPSNCMGHVCVLAYCGGLVIPFATCVFDMGEQRRIVAHLPN